MFQPYSADGRARADRVISGGASPTMRFEHLTAHHVNNLNWNSGTTTLLTNSLLVAVTNTGSCSGANNASSTSSSVFQTVGAGAHYLAGTTYRGLSTTNVNANLLAEVRARTTQPPLVLTNGCLVLDTTLNPCFAIRYAANAAFENKGGSRRLLHFSGIFPLYSQGQRRTLLPP